MYTNEEPDAVISLDKGTYKEERNLVVVQGVGNEKRECWNTPTPYRTYYLHAIIPVLTYVHLS